MHCGNSGLTETSMSQIKKKTQKKHDSAEPRSRTDAAKRVIPKLAEKTANWTIEQLQLLALKDEKLQKSRNTYNFQNKVLNDCKT